MNATPVRWLLVAALVGLGSASVDRPAAASDTVSARAPVEVVAARGSQPAEPAPPEKDPWGFDDEKKVETWGDIIRPQALSLTLLTGFFALALVSFFSKRVWLKYVTFVAAVGYMGFAKSYLISVVNVFALVQWDLPTVRYSLGWYLLAVFTVVSTVLWGRLYCGRMCAFGALTQLMDTVVPAKLRVEVPTSIERRAVWIKYGLLVAVVAYYLTTKDLLVYRWVEPFWMFGFFGSAPLWTALAILLVATIFVRNLYCRFFCAVGATLGLLSTVSVLRIKRWSECRTCRVCEKACSWGAIRGPKIDVMECVRCDDCERLYADTQKCPHWLVLKKNVKLGIRN